MSVIIMNISTTAEPYPSTTTNSSMTLHSNDSVFENEQHITYQTAAEFVTTTTTMMVRRIAMLRESVNDS